MLYRAEGIEGSHLGGPAYWLKTATGNTVGTMADVNTLVRYAAGLERPAGPVMGSRASRG